MSSPKLNVTQFLLFESGTYNEQFRRPISTAMDSGVISRVQEATQYGANLSPSALSRVASEILMPCTWKEGNGILIPNGWGTKRFYFILEISTGRTGHGQYRKVLTGYTDMADTSFGGHLPPEMCLHINGHMTLRDVGIPGPHGVQYQTTVVGNDQILLGNFQRMNHNGNDHSLRPYDVMRRLGTAMSLENEDTEGAVQFDMTTTFFNGVKNNARKNTNPGSYMSRLLTACKESELANENQFLDNATAMADSAAGMLNEGLLSDDAVFSLLNRATEFATQGFITLYQLESLAPGAEANAVVHKYGGVHAVKRAHQVGDSQHWAGENMETVIASRIAQALPGILLDCALNRMSLTLTNQTNDGSYMVVPADHTIGSTIKGIDLIQQANAVIARIRNELMPGITKNNLVGVYITVDCDTFSDTRINVSVEGGVPETFVSATFADSLFSPVITGNMQTVHQLINDVGNLSNNLSYHSNLQPQPKIYTGAPKPTNPGGGGFGNRFR